MIVKGKRSVSTMDLWTMRFLHSLLMTVRVFLNESEMVAFDGLGDLNGKLRTRLRRTTICIKYWRALVSAAVTDNLFIFGVARAANWQIYCASVCVCVVEIIVALFWRARRFGKVCTRRRWLPQGLVWGFRCERTLGGCCECFLRMWRSRETWDTRYELFGIRREVFLWLCLNLHSRLKGNGYKRLSNH